MAKYQVIKRRISKPFNSVQDVVIDNFEAEELKIPIQIYLKADFAVGDYFVISRVPDTEKTAEHIKEVLSEANKMLVNLTTLTDHVQDFIGKLKE
jgi:hypothetical protein